MSPDPSCLIRTWNQAVRILPDVDVRSSVGLTIKCDGTGTNSDWRGLAEQRTRGEQRGLE